MITIREIKIDIDKCIGCRSCEFICSAFHNKSLANPKRSRIRVFVDRENNIFVPIIAGCYTAAECNARNVIVINGIQYGQCSFCRASCPSRELFKEPDANIPLKCDLCGESLTQEPMCVKWCLTGALTLVEKEEEKEEAEKQGPNFVVIAYDVEAKDIKKALKDEKIKVRSVEPI